METGTEQAGQAIEVWRAIPGYENLYEASSHGRIKSLDRVVVRKLGKPYVQKGGIRKPGSGKNKYLSLSLSINGETATRYVHHLVLISFVGPAPDGMEACHGDGDRQNNRIGNLRWDTRPGNHADKASHGTDHKGERHPGAKLTDETVKGLRARRIDGLSYAALAKEFGISVMTAFRAVTGRSWNHLK